MISILLVEDNPFVVDALDGLLDTYPDIELVARARTAAEALFLLPDTVADLALVDLALPDMNGIDLVAAMRRTRPELPCVILTAHREPGYVQRALAVGARGYITKEQPLAIIDGVERVLAGEVYLSPDLRD